MKKAIYISIFLLLFCLICYLLASSLSGRWFYPYHYRELIVKYATEYRLDPLLVAAVIHTESSFRKDAVSSEGASGLMQIMPSTAKWAAEMIGLPEFKPEMLFEPRYNIAIGAWYLADLLKQFEGNQVVALAAYNGGRGEVSRWLEQEIWDGRAETLKQVPFSETRNFVRRVLEAYRRYAEIYGR